MLGSKHLLADRQGALLKGPCSGKVTLGLKQEGEVVEARRGIWMLGSIHLLADRQGALMKGPRTGVSRLAVKILACAVQSIGTLHARLCIRNLRFADENEMRRQ